MTRRVVVTGASGNVGTAVLRRLADEDVELIGLARRIPDRGAEPYSFAHWHALDVGSPDAPERLREVMQGADAVIHLAWQLQPNHDERELIRTNVTGFQNVLGAAAAVGVDQVVYASSVGAYSVGSKRELVDESWPTGGLHTSHYSRHKAMNERILDRFAEEHPQIVVARLRPGLIFQRQMTAEITTLFVGPLVPPRLLGRLRLPVLPLPAQFRFQAVHSDDVADAYARVVLQRASGAFNVAADPVLDPATLAELIAEARVVPIRFAVLRSIIWLTWKARVQKTDPGWADLAAYSPLMSTERARSELGWSARHSSLDTVRDLLGGLSDSVQTKTSPALKR